MMVRFSGNCSTSGFIMMEWKVGDKMSSFSIKFNSVRIYNGSLEPEYLLDNGIYRENKTRYIPLRMTCAQINKLQSRF